MPDSPISSEDRGVVRIVTIDRPKALNALNPQVVADLTTAVATAASDAAAGRIRGLVLTGGGNRAFVAGADIAAMATMSASEAEAFARAGHALGEQLAALPIPVIAAVRGFALGGGCELALACDFIYASPSAKFGQPEVKLGVIPGFGGTQRLLRRVGLARALELCLTGEIIGAEAALQAGLVNRIVSDDDDVVAVAIATCTTIATMGPEAVAVAKHVLHRGAELPLPTANALEIAQFARLFTTADQREGMAAFLAKRPAAFTGHPNLPTD